MKKRIIDFIKGIYDILQIALKLILVCVIIFGSYEYLNNVFYNKDINGGDDFRAMPENSIDVIVLGSSHAQYSFAPQFFYYDSGLYSYVMGSSCQPYEVSYEMLKEVLKTQSPKLLIMEVFTAMPMSSMCEGESCYIRAANMMTGDERVKTISYLSEEKAEEYKNEFFNYHNDWKTLENYDELLPSEVFKETALDDNFGYVYQELPEFPSNWWHTKKYSSDLEVELNDIDRESLEKIYELCQENDIEILFYKTPIDTITQEDQSYLHKVWQWAEEKEIPYIDFTKTANEIGLFMQIHSDSYHAYVNGASIITNYIAEYINELDIEFNHKEDEDLTTEYKDGGRFYALAAVRSETDPEKYLKRMKNSDDYIIINYNPDRGVMSETMYNWLLQFGLNQEVFNRYSQYYAIIRDCVVINESNECAYLDNGEVAIYSSFASTQYQWNQLNEKTDYALSITMVNPISCDFTVKYIDVRKNFDSKMIDYDLAYHE